MKNKNQKSSFKKILFFGLSQENLGQERMKKINGLCKQKVFLAKDNPQLEKQLSDTDCLLINQGMTVDQKMIDAAPNLRYIGICATGYGRIDTQYAASKGIVVCNVPGYATEAVAEFVFSMILENIREIERAKQQTAKGIYSEATFTGTQIKDKTFGVIGLGGIGSRVAEIAQKGFRAKTIYWSRKRKEHTEQSGIVYKPLKNVIKESDIISLHLSLNGETEKIIDKKIINSIKSGAILVNTAPMELIDLKALETRLKKRDITFILDHSDEMTTKDINRLKKFKNCIIYPPIGFTTKEATALKKEILIKNIENFLFIRDLEKLLKEHPINKVN